MLTFALNRCMDFPGGGWCCCHYGHKAYSCFQGGENDLGLWLYTPDSTQDGSWSEEPEKKLMDVLGKCDERSVGASLAWI
jgi:hypothetical protein